MKTRLWKIIFAILLLPVWVNATTIDFYTDGTITDGNVFDTVNIWNTATVDMIGGVVTWSFNTYNTSTLNISGGDTSAFINLHDDSILNLSGGIEHAWIYPDTGTVNFYGRDLIMGEYGEKYVHGYWADGTEFTITLARIENANIVFHEIPEPATISLLLAGILGVRKFRG
ncbi:MAG: hypothetical protein NTW93_10035 [Phycisphaerae bacterium]|nr:hypothetical protein [Phycisphaerae bacterium]